MNYEDYPYTISSKLEKALGVERTEFKYPYFSVPEGFEIAVTFPFAGAAARFRVRHKENLRSLSIYLDTKDVLGIYGEPYWEVCPIGDDTARFSMADTEGLWKAIIEELNK